MLPPHLNPNGRSITVIRKDTDRVWVHQDGSNFDIDLKPDYGVEPEEMRESTPMNIEQVQKPEPVTDERIETTGEKITQDPKPTEPVVAEPDEALGGEGSIVDKQPVLGREKRDPVQLSLFW